MFAKTEAIDGNQSYDRVFSSRLSAPGANETAVEKSASSPKPMGRDYYGSLAAAAKADSKTLEIDHEGEVRNFSLERTSGHLQSDLAEAKPVDVLIGFVTSINGPAVECVIDFDGQELELALSSDIFRGELTYGSKFRLFYDKSGQYKTPVAEVVPQAPPPADDALREAITFFEEL